MSTQQRGCYKCQRPKRAFRRADRHLCSSSCWWCQRYSWVVFWLYRSAREAWRWGKCQPGPPTRLIWELCVWSVTTGHGLLIHKASPRPCYVCSAPCTHTTTLTRPRLRHTRERPCCSPPTHVVHTYKPSIPCHTHARTPACLVAHPAAPTRLAAPLSLQWQMSVWEAFPPGSGLAFKTAAKRCKKPHANGVGEQWVCVCARL